MRHLLLQVLLPLALAESMQIDWAARHLNEDALFTETNLMAKANQLGSMAVAHHRRLQGLTDNPLWTLCRSLEGQFLNDVQCECVGALKSGTLSFTCRYQEQICGDEVCGRPELAATLVNGDVFSASTCIYDYTNQRRNLSYEDTCVSIEICSDSADGVFCGCEVSYNAQVCQLCDVCNDGSGIELDCTNVNAEAVSNTCRTVDSDLDLAGGAGFIAGFVPTFEGFCSRLEEGVDDRIACDCSHSGGGNFDVSCETKEEVCTEGGCGDIKSTVSVAEGVIANVTSCVDYHKPYNWEQVCTTVEVCREDDDRLCGCQATYGGEKCTGCGVCLDGKSMTLDCSNVERDAVFNTCQPVSARSVFEFVPSFPPSESLKVPGGSSRATTTSRAAISVFISFAVAAYSFL